MTDLLDVRELQVRLNGPKRHLFARPAPIHALRGVSFSVAPGETLAIVGESGSGKSTMARALMRLTPASGSVRFEDLDGLTTEPARVKALRRQMQMVFQDPYSSLNRRMRIGAILEEPLRVHGIGDRAARRDRVNELVAEVGLGADTLERFPAALSGGQRQRVAIARALALRPKLVICDEAISALDVSVQAQILNLLTALKREHGLSYIFITHDLGVVRRFADRIAVMHAGRIVELATAEDLFRRPLHPYTRALLSAVPHPDRSRARPERIRLQGEPISPLATPRGCLFASRCGYFAPGLCDGSDPDLAAHAAGQHAACHRIAGGRPAWETAKRETDVKGGPVT